MPRAANRLRTKCAEQSSGDPPRALPARIRSPVMAKAVRPPYASGDGVRTLFQKMRGLGPPAKTVDNAWVKSYDIQKSQPEAIVGLMRWLGIIDEQGVVDKAVWQKL